MVSASCRMPRPRRSPSRSCRSGCASPTARGPRCAVAQLARPLVPGPFVHLTDKEAPAVSMPFGYVSPAQAMRDKAEYARQGIGRGRSCVTLQYQGGILLMAPNPSSALHKISEIYDRIAFAAVGRYNEYENLRKAGITYADITGYQFDRHDVTARGIANYYAQNLGTIFTENLKPFEVEIVVAEVGRRPEEDQIYRITFDGSVTDEPGFVAFGGQADQVSAALKEHYSPGLSLPEAFGVALSALSASGNGERSDVTAASLEVAILDRARDHRAFRRIRGARLEELIAG